MAFDATKLSELDKVDTSADLHIGVGCTLVLLANKSLEKYTK